MPQSLIRRIVRGAAPIVLASVMLGGCNMWYIVDPHFTAVTISTAHRDVFVLAYDARSCSVDVSAPSVNTDSNNRGVFWPTRQHPVRDGETCARWTDEDHATKVAANIQEGAALRVRTNRDGSLDAITVTRNVWLDGLVDLQREHVARHRHLPPGPHDGVGCKPARRLRGLPETPLEALRQGRRCQVELRRLAAGGARPAYGDATHGGTITLPPNEVFAGHFGVYVGHLAPGQSVDYDEMTVTGL